MLRGIIYLILHTVGAILVVKHLNLSDSDETGLADNSHSDLVAAHLLMVVAFVKHRD